MVWTKYSGRCSQVRFSRPSRFPADLVKDAGQFVPSLSFNSSYRDG